MSALLGIFRFTALMHPWALILLALVPVLFLVEVFARTPGTLTVSTGEVLAKAGAGRGARFRWLPALLRAVGLALLIIGLARPLKGFQPRKDRASVVDIMLCVDVSGSMLATDFEYAGEARDRLSVTKAAVRHFLDSRKNDTGDRYGLDRVGLVLYGAYAWTQCPLTLDYGVLERELALAQIDERDAKHKATAIGSAIGLAVSRLRSSEAEAKVIILLTDGQNNAGELDPMTAARLAKEYGIRIYSIGAGSGNTAYITQRGPFNFQTQQRVDPVDEEALKKIAEATDGKYFRATDTASLEGAYSEINQLEATEIELDDYYEHEEAFVPFVVAGMTVLALAVFVRRTWFETIP